MSSVAWVSNARNHRPMTARAGSDCSGGTSTISRLSNLQAPGSLLGHYSSPPRGLTGPVRLRFRDRLGGAGQGK